MSVFMRKPQPARLHKKVTRAEKVKASYNAVKFNVYTLILFISLKMNKPEPVRLAKKDTNNNNTLPKIKGIIIVIAAILLMILFVGVCFAIVPGPESNLYYYHLNG